MGTEQVEALEANLDGQIEELKHPTQAAGVPWSNAPAEPEAEAEEVSQPAEETTPEE